MPAHLYLRHGKFHEGKFILNWTQCIFSNSITLAFNEYLAILDPQYILKIQPELNADVNAQGII